MTTWLAWWGELYQWLYMTDRPVIWTWRRLHEKTVEVWPSCKTGLNQGYGEK